MHTRVQSNPLRLISSLRLTAAFLIAIFTISSTFAEINMTLNLDRTGGAFYPYIYMYADEASEPATYHRVESPNGLIFREIGSQNGSNYGSQTYAAMISECTAGPWTITTNVGDPSEEEYTFTVGISGLSEGLFGDVSVTNPPPFSTVSTNRPLIEWTSTSLFPEVHAQVHNGYQGPEPGNYYTAPAPVNSWTPPSPVLPGTNYVYLAYQTNDHAGITFSTPMTGGGSPLTNWVASADVSSYDFSEFVAPGSNTCSDPLNLAVECPGFSWYTDEYEPWVVSTNDFTVGPSSLQSSASEWGSSYLEAMVQGPAVVTFDWALFGSYGDSFEFYSYDNSTGYDSDSFYYEGYQTYGWDTYTVTLSSNDIYYLSWYFYGDETNDFHPDAAFLDNVRYTYTGSNSVTHEAEFEIEIQRVTSGTNTHYLVLPRLNNVIPSSSLDEVVSPNNLCSGTDSSSTSIHFASLQAVIDELEYGPWTIYFDRNGASYEYDFTISANSLSTNDLPPVTITQPLDGSTGVSTASTFEWSGPSSWNSAFIYVRDVEAATTVDSSSVSPTATDWTASVSLPEATNSVVISYYKNSFSGLSFSHPSSGSQALTSWFASSRLSSRGFSEFVVSGGITPLPVSILSPVISGGNFGLSFVSQSGVTHVVEWTPSLTNTMWYPATNFPGDGMTNTVNIATTNDAAFFRVKTQ